MSLDDSLLDEPEALVEIDQGRMLASTAAASAGIRTALDADCDRIVAPLVEQGRPRSLVVVGSGGSSAIGEVLSAVAGRGSAVPVFGVSGPSLPGWVGPMDLVVAVSASGSTPEVLSVVGEARRRGCSVMGIGAAGSALAEICSEQQGAIFWPVSRLSPMQDEQRARSLLWALSAPLILLAEQLGLVQSARHGLAAAATRLDERAVECGVQMPTSDNPAKDLSIHLTSGLPLIWGSADVGSVAARRAGRQLAENADWPSVVGTLPEAVRTHAGLLRGAWAMPPSEEDIFRDRTLDTEPAPRLRVLLLRDPGEHPDTAGIADAARSACERLEIGCVQVMASGGHVIEQLADLVALVDFASVYAALMQSVDPSTGAGEVDPRFERPGGEGPTWM